MDQGLKERLVGAAVLVAIAVWLIPWVLDGPEGGAEPPVSSLQLPSAEEPMPMRTQTLKLHDEPEPSAELEVTPPSAQLAAATAATARASEPAPERDEFKPEAAATLVVANTVAEPPKAAPASAPAPKPQASAAGDWTVQLGSFEDEANARRLAQRAVTYGHKAEVSSYKNGARTLYRVRVGPQATKAAADATASALRAHGVDARVVAAR
jgi:DedD protein